jgi:hypothetical protein
MYPNNITVLSKISNEIVFHKNFDKVVLRGIQVDPSLNKVMMYASKEFIYSTSLKGED